jgi:hypothetical protein
MGDDWLDERVDEEDVAEDEEKIDDEGVKLVLLKEVEVFCAGAGRDTGRGGTDSASCRACNGEEATIVTRQFLEP